MGSSSIWHWLAVCAVALLVFGGGNQLSNIMSDAAKGIKAFKDGLAADEESKPEAAHDLRR